MRASTISSSSVPFPSPAPRRRRRFAPVLALLLGVGLVLSGCGDDDDSDGARTTGDDGGGDGGGGYEVNGDSGDGGGGGGGDAVAYEVSSISYTDVTAPAGGSIEITNTSGAPHTFTADDGAFDVEYGAEETATVDVPEDAGEYPFHCEIHPSMEATLTVE